MHDRWEDLALGAMHAQHIIQELATATLGVLMLASDACAPDVTAAAVMR